MRFVDDATLDLEIANYAGEKSLHAKDVHDLLIELQARRKHAGSGCACDIVDDDDGSEEYEQNGERIRQWCGLHQWHRDRKTAQV